MRTWVITAITIKPEAEAKRTMVEFADVPRQCQSMFAPKCHNCTMCSAFKMQPELHNSADRGIFKFVYLRLCLRLVVCFYPRPPAWPWSWGYTYRHLTCVECYCFFNGNFEFSSDHSNSILADPIVSRPWENHLIEGAPFISRSEIDHPDWHEQQRLLGSLFEACWKIRW